MPLLPEYIPSEEPQKLRVLVAEDDPDLSDLLCASLESNGYSVETVFSGDVALRRLSGKKYAAAIMDERMPGLNGGMVLKQCRVNSPPITTPMVIVSAYATQKDKAQFVKDGASAFFAKPYEICDLLKKVRELACDKNEIEVAK